MANEKASSRIEIPVIRQDGPPAMTGIRKDMVPERVFSFEKAPDPIPEAEIQGTFSSDVVIAGGGLAGVSGAMAAVEAGAQTILIEKTNTFASFGGDIAAVGSRMQKKLGIEIDKDEVLLALMKYGANKPDQSLLRLWAEGSGASMDWLLDMTEAAGLKVEMGSYPPPANFNNADEYYPQYLATHHFGLRNKVVQTILEAAVKKGLKVYTFTRAKQLSRTGKSRVTGLIAQDKEGRYIRFQAKKAVILCTGDYGSNAEMMAKYCPQAAYLPSLKPTSTGEGHQMAMWVGAMMEEGPHAPMSHAFASEAGNYPFLQVNLRGQRFQNEDVPGQSYTNAWERQPGRTAWQVFDSKYVEQSKTMGIGHAKIPLTPETVKNLEKQLLQAATIDELGAKMGLPVSIFKATVQRYNELAHLGKDLDFAKRPDRLFPIETPPFYAGKGRYALLCVMGGLNLNTKLQALDKEWEVIPGLYLAGNTMGNRFAVDYPTIVPGISLGMALHYGKTAGHNAATLE